MLLAFASLNAGMASAQQNDEQTVNLEDLGILELSLSDDGVIEALIVKEAFFGLMNMDEADLPAIESIAMCASLGEDGELVLSDVEIGVGENQPDEIAVTLRLSDELVELLQMQDISLAELVAQLGGTNDGNWLDSDSADYDEYYGSRIHWADEAYQLRGSQDDYDRVMEADDPQVEFYAIYDEMVQDWEEEELTCELSLRASSLNVSPLGVSPGDMLNLNWSMTGVVSSQVYLSVFSGWGAQYYHSSIEQNTGSFSVLLPSTLDASEEFHAYVESAENGQRTTMCWDYASFDVLGDDSDNGTDDEIEEEDSNDDDGSEVEDDSGDELDEEYHEAPGEESDQDDSDALDDVLDSREDEITQIVVIVNTDGEIADVTVIVIYEDGDYDMYVFTMLLEDLRARLVNFDGIVVWNWIPSPPDVDERCVRGTLRGIFTADDDGGGTVRGLVMNMDGDVIANMWGTFDADGNVDGMAAVNGTTVAEWAGGYGNGHFRAQWRTIGTDIEPMHGILKGHYELNDTGTGGVYHGKWKVQDCHDDTDDGIDDLDDMERPEIGDTGPRHSPIRVDAERIDDLRPLEKAPTDKPLMKKISDVMDKPLVEDEDGGSIVDVGEAAVGSTLGTIALLGAGFVRRRFTGGI